MTPGRARKGSKGMGTDPWEGDEAQDGGGDEIGEEGGSMGSVRTTFTMEED